MMTNEQIDGLKKAVEISPDNVLLRKILADALFDTEQYENAAEEYKLAMKLDKEDIDLPLGLAESFIGMGKFNAARMVVEEILNKEPQDGEVNLVMSKIALGLNDLKTAKEQLDLAMDQFVFDDEYEELLNEKLKNSGEALPYDTSLEKELDDLFDRSSLEKPLISYEEVGGMEHIKEELRLKAIYPLEQPTIYKAYGKAVGGGVLLYGPPGCGKTMLARATAGEMGANFQAVAITDVLDMWVGTSERNLHEIFENARLNSPTLLFFDEVDAIGASRMDLRNSNSRFLVNQFLDEMDGLKFNNEGVLILAATNCPWFMDSALRRPGRFDKTIFVAPPSKADRMEILKIILKSKPTENIDYEKLANLTKGFSGADLQAVVNQAIELILPRAIKRTSILPITQDALEAVAKNYSPTTEEWFNIAKKFATESNDSAFYQEMWNYIKEL